MIFKQGSHRMKDSWLDERYNWLDGDGRPVHEDWTRCNKVTEVNDLGEPEQMAHFKEVIVDANFSTDYKVIRGGKEITVPVINLDFDGSDIFELELLAGVHKTPKMRAAERRKEFEKKMKDLQKPKQKNGCGS